MTELWIPPSASVNAHKKAPPPKTGPSWDVWGEGGLTYLKMPGGGVLQFDLERLTMDDYRSMRDHYQINASLKILTFMIHQLDWRIECKDKKIADEVHRQILPLWTPLVRSLAVAFWAGYAPTLLEWENNTNERKVQIDKVKDIRPEKARVEWKKVKGYAPGGQRRPDIKVYNGINVDGVQWPIPPDSTLWYPLLMESGNYYGTKLLKPAFVPWFFSQLIHLFVNRYFERFGEPLPIGRADYDAEVNVNGEMVTGRDAMETIVRNLRNRSVVVMPSDRDSNGNYEFDLEYLEGQMRGADFERYLTRLDEEMSVGLFTPILLFRAGAAGSYNLGVSQMQLFLWMLNALAGDMKQYIDEYVCERIKAVNFSPNAPRVEWVPRKMGKENVETMRAVVTELLRGDRAGVDLDELGQAIGLTVNERRVLDSDPGDEPDPDDRIGRPDRKTGQAGPGEPRATERQISARVAAQIRNAYGTDKWATFHPDWGYRRQLSEEIGGDTAIDFYSRLDTSWDAILAGCTIPVEEVIATTDALINTQFEKATE